MALAERTVRTIDVPRFYTSDGMRATSEDRVALASADRPSLHLEIGLDPGQAIISSAKVEQIGADLFGQCLDYDDGSRGDR